MPEPAEHHRPLRLALDTFRLGALEFLRRRRLLGWLALTVAAFVLAEITAWHLPGGDLWAGLPGVLRGTALLCALLGAAGELRRSYGADRARLASTRAQVGELRLHLDAAQRRSRIQAHEARTALLAIERAAQFLATGETVPGIDPAALRTAIEDEIALLRDLLAIPAVVVEPDQADLAGSVASAVAMARLHGTEVVAHVSPGLRAATSRRLVTQVVQGLLDNACRHAPGSRVTVFADGDGEEVEVRVSDDGPGVSGDPARIFDEGVSRRGPGHGMGLFIAAGLVRRAGGRIWAEYPPHGGTTIAFTLPACAPQPAAVGVAL